MGRPPVASIAVATRERLLSAAEEVFACCGLTDARLAEIAAMAGITRASLLYHFTSKDELYDAVVDRAMSALGEIVASSLALEGDLRARVRAINEGFFTYVDVHPQLARILVREVVAGRPGIVERATPLIDEVVAHIVRERPQLDAIAARHRLMMVVSEAFLRTAVGANGAALWGDGSRARETAELLLVEA